MTTYTDRSRILCHKRCNRERFLNYHCHNTGIVLSKLIISLSTGIAIHDGVTRLLKGEDIEQAVEETLKAYEKEVKSKEIEVEDGIDQLFIYQEQKSLIEAMIRVYEKIQLPRILGEYEVLEVEKEILYPLYEDYICDGHISEDGLEQGSCNGCVNMGIILMSKPDAILRDKSTNNLVVYSLKTSSSWTDTNEKQNKYDDQGISELIATEHLYKGTEIVEAIKMDFLIKGQRQYLTNEYGEKVKLQNSFLVHPYALDTGFSSDYRVEYTRAKGWRRINIWEEMSIKEWVDILYTQFYEALDGGYDSNGNKKNGIIVTPYPYVREQRDIDDWLEQNRHQEQVVRDNLVQLKGIDAKLPGHRESVEGYRTLVNRLFPQNRHSCYSYGRFCTFVEHCWEGEKTTSSMFEARKPHHSTEPTEKGDNK